MQMIADFATPDYPAWKSDFDADPDGRMQAGLSLLQIWRDADDPARTLCLFEVNDRAKAESWAKSEGALGSAASVRFLKTA
jgi:hypothetical protein